MDDTMEAAMDVITSTLEALNTGEPNSKEVCSTHGNEDTGSSTKPPKSNDEVNTNETSKKEEISEKTPGPANTSADGKDKTPEAQNMKCEIKHLDRRYNDNNERYLVEPKEQVDTVAQKDWWQLFAFCVVHSYDTQGKLKEDCTRLHVNPQPLRQLLYDVIGDYASDPIDIEDVKIETPYHSLFHYRQQLRVEGFKRFEADEDSLAQVKLLLSWTDEKFEQETAAYEKCVTRGMKSITWDKLWTLFPPGTTVYRENHNQHEAYKVLQYWYDTSDSGDKFPHFLVRVQFIDFDGDELGIRKTRIKIPKYTGSQDLADQEMMPLSLLDDADEMREALVKRGRKFESYIGQWFVNYEGTALKYDPTSQQTLRFYASGRVMIDCKTVHRYGALYDSFSVSHMPKGDNKNYRVPKKVSKSKGASEAARAIDKLSDDDVIYTNSVVRGYSFTNKKFLDFFVDDLSPIEWNTRCFEDLVIDPDVKKMVQALVSTHMNERSSIDDIVKGKGKGLVCVLHGPPGVGKTLTAECVAEYARRPLYMVSSGDLGDNCEDMDKQLTRIMDLTSAWNAVLLIDEADVFLELRELRDVHRNAMVSVCLRNLEYYSGILFLTTNRVATFDEAFKSRIHIPIRYTDLTTESRKQIWRAFCAKIKAASADNEGGRGIDINEAGLEALAQHDLNGRQIKNIVKTAESLAIYDDVRLDLQQLQQVTKLQAVFDKDVNRLAPVDYTAPGEPRKDADAWNMFL